MTESSFPRLYARTQRFTLGRPRNLTVTADGVLFLRSRSGEESTHDLWLLDADTGEERRLTDATSLVSGAEQLTAAERARRERLREGGAGIVAYSTDGANARVAFALDGHAWVMDLPDGSPRQVGATGSVYDPRLSPDGQRLAAVVGGALHVADLPRGLEVRCEEPEVTWGQADFVAAEEMQRTRGYWWAPDSSSLLVCRVDDRDVPVFHLGDPANPDVAPVAHRYPAAGTTNPDVTLWLVDPSDGQRTQVRWDADSFPYLAQVRWDEGPALLLVQSRDQRRWQILQVDADGATAVLQEDTDRHWLDIVPGSPRWFEGRLAVVVDRGDHGEGGSRALLLDGEVVTAPGMQVRALAGVRDGALWLTCSQDDPASVHVARVDSDGEVTVVTDRPGVHGVAVGDVGVVVSRSSLDELTATLSLWPDAADDEAVGLTNLQCEPPFLPAVRLLRLGERQLVAGLVMPDGDEPCPVLLLPYGGPHAQRVLQSSAAFLTAQWFADHGFAVLVVDGRGTPGRGPAFERAVHYDLAGPVLDDQVDALLAAAAQEPRLDLQRVGISGWSFGGYLAALAVLRRPDIFHAGIAGAPVVQWGLYDTHYTERYLGDPSVEPEAYERSDLVSADGELIAAPVAQGEEQPDLLIIHGLADDNVVAAHALRLSSAMLAAGRRHEFLPLVGVTHMTPQEVVAQNLLLHQLRFLQRCLAGRGR